MGPVKNIRSVVFVQNMEPNMKAMSYLIAAPAYQGAPIGDPKPELSIFIDKYNKETFFLFINREKGAFRLSVEDGKKRLEMIDKETAKIFEINADAFVIFDLIDTLINIQHDISTIINKYLPVIKPPAPPVESPLVQESTGRKEE